MHLTPLIAFLLGAGLATIAIAITLWFLTLDARTERHTSSNIPKRPRPGPKRGKL